MHSRHAGAHAWNMHRLRPSTSVRHNHTPHTTEAAFKRGLDELVWRSEGIDTYIRDVVELVRDLDAVLTTIKDNVARIVELLKTLARSLMIERKVGVGRRRCMCAGGVGVGMPAQGSSAVPSQ
jgi:predicted metalloprotease with PDZ domain